MYIKKIKMLISTGTGYIGQFRFNSVLNSYEIHSSSRYNCCCIFYSFLFLYKRNILDDNFVIERLNYYTIILLLYYYSIIYVYGISIFKKTERYVHEFYNLLNCDKLVIDFKTVTLDL